MHKQCYDCHWQLMQVLYRPVTLQLRSRIADSALLFACVFLTFASNIDVQLRGMDQLLDRFFGITGLL
jgi:hypothetical protein